MPSAKDLILPTEECSDCLMVRAHPKATRKEKKRVLKKGCRNEGCRNYQSSAQRRAGKGITGYAR